jgi:hypothetical protein
VERFLPFNAMNRREYMSLLGEKTSLERMLADTPEEDVLDRLSLTDRLLVITEIIAAAELDEREPARVGVTLIGEFQGVLPKARTFEFKLQSGATIIRGKVGPAADPDEINRHLHQPSRIALTSTQVGAGRPRYVLVAPPTWIGAPRDEGNE